MVIIQEVMSSPVITMLPTKNVVDAAKLMVEKNIETLIICWGEDAVGILTEKDIVRRVVAKKLPYSTKLLEIMSKPVITINVNSFLEEANRKMEENRVKRLPVEDKGRIVGIITATDILKSMKY
jgi:CBS domain-containing protein